MRRRRASRRVLFSRAERVRHEAAPRVRERRSQSKLRNAAQRGKLGSHARRGRYRLRRFGFFSLVVVLVVLVFLITDLGRSEQVATEGTPEDDTRESSHQISPTATAYELVAKELAGINPQSVRSLYTSTKDPSWASVHFSDPNEEETDFVVFLKEVDGVWEARSSVRVDEPNHPENDVAALEGVPEDLLNLYPEKLAAAGLKPLEEESIYLDELPKVGPPEIPSPEPIQDGVPILERDSMHKGLARAQRAIEGYEGEVGLYVRDLEEGWGYGIRADESFFSASVIKVPIMIAVYRKVDEGELSLQDALPTSAEDWAAGAGWLQWEPLGGAHTVQDYLWMMMTQSDNVATNALVRAVGGPDYVNEVAESLGAENTVLYQKVTSERAAVTTLDNRSTPRDMATLMHKIGTGDASSPESCEKMVELMRQNVHEPWLKGGVPEGVEVANKAGWLYRVHNEVGIVFHHERPYAVAILSKHGPFSSEQAGSLLSEISKALWEARSEG